MNLAYPQLTLFVIAPNYDVARSWAEVDNRIPRHRWRFVAPSLGMRLLYGRPRSTLIHTVVTPSTSLDDRTMAEVRRLVARGAVALVTADDLDWFRIPWSEIEPTTHPVIPVLKGIFDARFHVASPGHR